jgi:phage-related minor tail protein
MKQNRYMFKAGSQYSATSSDSNEDTDHYNEYGGAEPDTKTKESEPDEKETQETKEKESETEQEQKQKQEQEQEQQQDIKETKETKETNETETEQDIKDIKETKETKETNETETEQKQDKKEPAENSWFDDMSDRFGDAASDAAAATKNLAVDAFDLVSNSKEALKGLVTDISNSQEEQSGGYIQKIDKMLYTISNMQTDLEKMKYNAQLGGLMGGNNDTYFHKKYLKYKLKYNNLKLQ